MIKYTRRKALKNESKYVDKLFDLHRSDAESPECAVLDTLAERKTNDLRNLALEKFVSSSYRQRKDGEGSYHLRSQLPLIILTPRFGPTRSGVGESWEEKGFVFS